MKRQSLMLAATAMVALLLLLTLGAPLASADTFTSTINTGNSGLSGYPGPYGTVAIDLTSSTTATVTFTTNSPYLMGDGGSAALNVNATTFTATGIMGTNAGTGFTPGPFSTASGNEDGFGNFNLQINSFDGFTHASDTITFTLTDTSGTWSSAADVLIANALGNDAGIHVFVCATTPCNASQNTGVTGFAAEPSGSVPDGGMTLMLLGGALVGLETLRRKFGV